MYQGVRNVSFSENFAYVLNGLPQKYTYPLKNEVTALPIHIDQFAVDLHGFFTLSFARREDYSSMEELIDIMLKYLLRHSSVR